MKRLSINTIDASAIHNLFEDQVMENHFLDYKKALDFSDQGKRDFLKDICAFANASGGQIIYGIEDECGAPKSLHDVPIQDFDQLRIRLYNLVRSGIQPLILGMTIERVRIEDKNLVVVGIPRSWNAPHMVSLQERTQFQIRSNAGNATMKYDEIRRAFVNQAELPNSVRSFVKGRIDERNLLTQVEPQLLLHFVPLTSFRLGPCVDIQAIHDQVIRNPIALPNNSTRFNLDGVLQGVVGEIAVQYFRNGSVEVWYKCEGVQEGPLGIRLIATVNLCEFIAQTTKRAIDHFTSVRIEPPIYLFATLLGVNGVSLALDSADYMNRPKYRMIDRYVVEAPEVQIDNLALDTSDIIKPCLDVLWQASGFKECKWARK